MTPEQADELRALIRVYATKRVRKYAVSKGIGGAFETPSGTEKASANAHQHIEAFIQQHTNTKQTP